MSIHSESTSARRRHVGVELEFGGLTLDRICQLVRQTVGGDLKKVSRYTATLDHTTVGPIKVELDAALFNEFKLRGLLRGLPVAKGHHELTDLVEKALASEARRWVPFELVFSPLSFDRIGELDAICRALSAEAEGTGASICNAFGLHFNPELPDTEPVTILRYLRAFLVLFEDLKKAHRIDRTRQISSFITPFPGKYRKRVLDPSYEPDTDQLIRDYLANNATRNRALDLLPLLAHLNEDLVKQTLPKEKINARPTLHYRLPDCRIDDPDWSITREWKIFCRLDALANNPEKLNQSTRTDFEAMQHPLRARFKRWVQAIRRRLHAS